MAFDSKKINLLLIEDEDYDVRRVMNTVKPFEDRINVLDIVSNGMAALELLHNKKGKFDVCYSNLETWRNLHNFADISIHEHITIQVLI